MTVDFNSPWAFVLIFVVIATLFFGLYLGLKSLMRRLGIDPDRPLGLSKTRGSAPSHAVDESLPLIPVEQAAHWSRIATGFGAIAAGAWLELGGKLYHHLKLPFGPEKVDASERPLSATILWNEFFTVLGSIVTLVGLLHFIGVAVSNLRPRLLWGAIACEFASLGARLLPATGILTVSFEKPWEAEPVVGITLGASLSLDYLGVILLVLLGRDLLRDWPEYQVQRNLRSGIILPAVLLAAAVIQTASLILPLNSLPAAYAKPVVAGLLIAIVIAGMVRLLWLFMFARLMGVYAGAVRSRCKRSLIARDKM